MIQDSLPFDINRNSNVTLEGMVCSIIYPIIRSHFTNESCSEITNFSLYYIPPTNNTLYKILVSLNSDMVSFKLKLEPLFNQTQVEIRDEEVYDFLFNSKAEIEEKFLDVQNGEFSVIHPNRPQLFTMSLGYQFPK